MSLQIKRAAENNVPLEQFASLFEFGLQLVVADGFGSIRQLSNKLLKSSESSNRRSFECTSELLNIHKFGSLAPRKDSFHPDEFRQTGEARRNQLGVSQNAYTNELSKNVDAQLDNAQRVWSLFVPQ